MINILFGVLAYATKTNPVRSITVSIHTAEYISFKWEKPENTGEDSTVTYYISYKIKGSADDYTTPDTEKANYKAEDLVPG